MPSSENARKADELIHEALSLITENDSPTMFTTYVLVGAGNEVTDGMEQTVVWYPDEQPPWKTLGLLNGMALTVEEDIKVKYRKEYFSDDDD